MRQRQAKLVEHISAEDIATFRRVLETLEIASEEKET